MSERPIMTRAELAEHEVGQSGRDYFKSDDGYSDMEVAATQGWTAISGWGQDGWDLGDWPYVVVSVRDLAIDGPGTSYDRSQRYEMRQTIEGDTTVYTFRTIEDRNAAIDYLFVWYGLGDEHDEWIAEGLTSDKREALDVGTLRVPNQFRGPFSWARCDVAEIVSS